jgi:hypothetical protein
MSKIIHSMGQSSSYETKSPLASQEIPCLLWNTDVHCHFHKNIPLDLILSLENPVLILIQNSGYSYSHLYFNLYF